jgi:anti-anti-sigma factor
MDINESNSGNAVIIQPVVRIDTNTSTEVEEKLVEILDRSETNIVVDLNEIDYVSSAGLRVFLMAAKKLKSLSGNFILASMNDHIKEVFDISGFTPIFTITPDTASAVDAIN